ncbi:rna polymerase ii elongator [Moniliophthora roreri]|nr:rna polymerase ii elongator [Moniliophthora roreri]
MELSTNYITASTNRHPHVADIASDSTVLFGSASQVCLWDASDEETGITETIYGHEGVVTCIRSLSPASFVSADDRGVVHYWRKEKEGGGSQACVVLCASSAMYIYSFAMPRSGNPANFKLTGNPFPHCMFRSRLRSTTVDELIFYGQGDSQVKELQKIPLSGKYPLSLAMSYLPESQSTILAMGLTDRNVHIWTRTDENFVRAVSLTGHDDWIKGLSFSPVSSGATLVLASASQDGAIRLWNIELYKMDARSDDSGSLNDELLDAFEESLGDFTDTEEGGRQVSLKRHILSVKGSQGSSLYSITFDALLIGHEAGVTSISWQPIKDTSTPALLSTSTDSSVIIWSPSAVITHSGDTSASIWINRQRFGDVGGQRLGGFVGGLWKENGKEVMAWGWSGGWRRWLCVNVDEDTWEEVGAIGGHSGHVKDLDWSPNGAYVISVSLDQTTRVHSPIIRPGSSTTWHELARPQVHGYDLIGVAFLDNLKFASCADEKVTRVFEAPQRFVDLVETLGVAQVHKDGETRPVAASVPPLGLSNKATETPTPVASSRRPFEGELAAITLWPETEKVFGHGYESSTIAVSTSRKYVATACRATSPEHAVVRVNETTSWRPFGAPLPGHSLTVTRIAFSPNDEYVLSVSRDRSWRIFKHQADQGYASVASEAKAHGRIIWDCAWSPEGDVFATASRDKTVKIWGQDFPEKWSLRSTIKCPEAATAVDFTAHVGDQRLLAVGLETGDILIYVSTLITSWEARGSVKAHNAHITRIKWRPQTENEPQILASCSEDGTLRVLTVQ